MALARPITDHKRIRDWADERNARPACVKGTGGMNEPGLIRLDVPGDSDKGSLQLISWNEWFRRFEGNHLALLIQETTRGEQKSCFNRLVKRDTIDGGKPASRKRTTRSAPLKLIARNGARTRG